MGVNGVIGRNSELAEVDTFIRRSATHLAALSVTGPAGIGKTTIWNEAIRRASDLGYEVLLTRPTEAEAKYAFAGLTDLMSDVPVEAFSCLPGMQRQALDIALLRQAPTSNPLPRRLVATAVLSLLVALTERGAPALVAVDDAQWLDVATSEVLSFALRRLDRQPLGVLSSVRAGVDRPRTFEEVLPTDQRREVRLGPLSTASLHEIVKRQLGDVLPRPVLARIVAASHGNPFYGVEIARELVRTVSPITPAAMPVLPEEVHSLVRWRLRRLPSTCRRALLVAACLSRPSNQHVDVEALAPAEAAGVVEIDDLGFVRFTHPLLIAAVLESASSAEQREVHRSLAARVTDPIERARHLGLGAVGPNEAVAATLDGAAETAASRGALSEAGELARRALQLTLPADSERAARRSLLLARHLGDTGQNPGEARSILETALSRCSDHELRAELLLSMAMVCGSEGDAGTGYAHLMTALELTVDAALIGRIHHEAAWLSESDPQRALAHCEAATAVLEGVGTRALYSTALLYGAYLRLTTGRGADEEAAERGRLLQEDGDFHDLSPVPLHWPAWHDDFALSRSRLEAALARIRLVGDEKSVPSILSHLCEIETWTGDWSRAAMWAAEATEVAARSEPGGLWQIAVYANAYLDVHLGELDRAREAAASMLARRGDSGPPLRELRGRMLLGFAAMSSGDSEEAVSQFGRADAALEAAGYREPVRYRFHADQTEAVIAVGDLDAASALLSRFEARAAVFPRPWILATAARCRGLLLSAGGDLEGAALAMDEALRQHERLEMPFERARTLLAQGQLLRRRKQRRAARTALSEALAVLERLGSPLWVARAHGELARVPVRRAGAELTATEEEVGRLAASGMTNRQIAERAFLSTKTVEHNLARVYLKLQIHSRAELGRVFSGEGHPVKE
ncbi:MAG: AAA family ATPase [Acidimicrobiales bacterium]